MGKDEGKALSKSDPSWDLDDWDPDDTFLAERPNVSREDLKLKKQIPRDRLTSEAEASEQRWEEQLEDEPKPGIRPASDAQAAIANPEDAESAEDLADTDEAWAELEDDDEEDDVEDDDVEESQPAVDEDDDTFFDSMSVLKQILMLRKRQSAKLGKPATEAELMALAHDTLDRLPIDLNSNMDYIAGFVAKVIDADVS